jgi:hypothetical protein
MKKSENVRYHFRSTILLNIDEKHEICVRLIKFINTKTGNYSWREKGEPYLTYRQGTGLEDRLMRGMNEILLYLKNRISMDKYFEVEKLFMERHT